MTHWLAVMAGGALGAGARHAVNRAGMAMLGTGFPWWTLAVNVVGGIAMGICAGLFTRSGTGEGWRLFLITGVLGGFTTFSAFSLDAVTLWQRGEGGQAAAYVAASVVLAIAGLVAGLALAR